MAANPNDDTRPAEAQNAADLGFGRQITEDTGHRLLRPDGTFNVRREGLSFLQTIHLYHSLLTMSWPSFYAVVAGAYLLTNLLFALLYTLCGPDALAGSQAFTLEDRLWEGFFFSVQTLSTIGYGVLSPQTKAANLLVALEAMTGMLGVALATGLLFARFSRPTARILFSSNAVIAPFREITAFEFRIANGRSSQLTNVEATVLMGRRDPYSGIRRFYPMALERPRILFFPLYWVVVHPIDAESPLADMGPEDFLRHDTEFLILLSATEETFSQVVHVRSSYTGAEVRFGARFAPMTDAPDQRTPSIDLRRLGQTLPAALPGRPSNP